MSLLLSPFLIFNLKIIFIYSFSECHYICLFVCLSVSFLKVVKASKNSNLGLILQLMIDPNSSLEWFWEFSVVPKFEPNFAKMLKYKE